MFNVGDSVRLTFPFGTHEQGPGGVDKYAVKEAALSQSCIHSVGGGKGIYTIVEVVDLSKPNAAAPGISTGFIYLLKERPGYFAEKFLRPVS